MSEKNNSFMILEDMMQQEAKKYPHFVKDGIVDYETYDQQHLKILWILKETNDPDCKVTDLRQFLKVPNSYAKWRRTWFPVLQVSYGLLNSNLMNGNMDNFESLKPEFESDIKNSFSSLKKIAVININKTSGDKSISYKKLKEKYNLFKDYIMSQIRLINPDVIICCGVFWLMWKELEYFSTEVDESDYIRKKIQINGNIINEKMKAHFNSHRIFIETFHTNQRNISRKLYYESIIQTVKNWIQEYKLK